jgi:hypothetical protein
VSKTKPVLLASRLTKLNCQRLHLDLSHPALTTEKTIFSFSIPPNAQGWLWSEALGFLLGIHNRQLLYFSVEGAMVPTPQEAAKNEMFKVNQAMQIARRSNERAKQEKARADRLATKLKEFGIDPDDLGS